MSADLPVRINFQPAASAVPDFCLVDSGAPYGVRENGFTYGWSASNTANTRQRNSNLAPDQRYATFDHMQKNGSYQWEMALPNGTYTVRVAAGDADYFDSTFKINVEGVRVVDGTPTSTKRFVEGTGTIEVSDGRLTVSNAAGAVNNKIAFIEIAAGNDPIPVLSSEAFDASASESGDKGQFRIRRTGDLSQSLWVSYQITGTATNREDYQLQVGVGITIPAGKWFADVYIKPIDDALAEATETVTLRVTPQQEYSLGAAQSSTVKITDNDSTGTLVWSAKAATPVARVEGMRIVVNNKLYVFGGYLDSTWAPTARVDRYDPATNTWMRMNDMPERISHCGTTTDGRYVYMAGGYPGTTKAQAFATTRTRRYDPVNDAWTDLKPLPKARGGGDMIYLNGTLYYIAGSDEKRIDHNDVWALTLNDPNANWVAKAPLPQVRNHFGAAAINGQVYVIGGQTGQEDWVEFKNDVWSYDPAADKWITRASVPGVLHSHSTAGTFIHNGRIICIGGETNGKIPGKPYSLRNVDAYDPRLNTWTSLTPLPAPRSTGFGGSIGGEIIYAGGYNGAEFSTMTWVGKFN